MMKDSAEQDSNIQTSFTNPQPTIQSPPDGIQNAGDTEIRASKPLPAEPKSKPQDKFAGAWEGVVSANSIPMATLFINFYANNQYESQLANAYTGEMLSSSRGTWRIGNDGLLNLTAQEGPREAYSVAWTNQNSFNAVLVNATDESLIGLRVAFVRNN